MFKTLRFFLPLLSVLVSMAWPTAARAEFCWRDSYGRGAGAIPAACPNGDFDAGLCYTKCQAGYTGVGPVCWQNCPSGYPDFGVGCSKPSSYGRGAGYPWKFGDALNDSGMYNRCQADNGGVGTCEKNGLIVYPKCKAGFHQVGCCVCSPDCPSGLIDSGATCTKKSYGRGVGTIPVCAENLEYDAGLCYPKARTGYTGVGPVAWGNCPAGSPVNCGAGCAASDAECAESIQGQVLSVLEMVESIAETVVTGGSTAAVKAAAKAGVKASVKKFAAKMTKDAVRKQIKDFAKEQAKALPESQVENLVNAAAGEDFDYTSLDPTGIGAIVDAYNKKVCAAPAASSTPPPAVSAPTAKAIIPGSLYRLTNKKSGLVLDVNGGSNADEAVLIQWPQVNSGTGNNQKWWFQDAGGGSYRFVNKGSNKVLDIKAGSMDDGGELIQYTNTGAANQLWTLEAQSDGYYLLVSKNSGKALAVSGESLTQGARIVQWTKSSADHFKWRFDLVP